MGIVDAMHKLHEACAPHERDDLAGARRNATDTMRDLEAITPKGGSQKPSSLWIIRLPIRSGRSASIDRATSWPRSARCGRAVDSARQSAPSHRRSARLERPPTWLAMIQARQGHRDEAAQTIAPAVKSERELARQESRRPVAAARARRGTLCRRHSPNPGSEPALLREAAALMDGLAPEMRALHDVQRWREWIRQAQQGARPRVPAPAVARTRGEHRRERRPAAVFRSSARPGYSSRVEQRSASRLGAQAGARDRRDLRRWAVRREDQRGGGTRACRRCHHHRYRGGALARLADALCRKYQPVPPTVDGRGRALRQPPNRIMACA